ncbi:10176_t:CDS:2, partial [Dentiscutata heterogama]
LRPDIPMNTPKSYADLMKRCWSGNVEKRPDAREIYTTIGTWLNQCLFVPNSSTAKEFKRGDELLKAPQQLGLHPHNVLYSTFHDTKALTTKLQHPSKETLDIDIMNNDAFEIPDSIDNEDDSSFEIPDSIDNEDDSTFEIPDSIDNEEISDTLDEATDSLNNVDLNDIPITPTDESSVLHSVNIEGIKKENASESLYQQKNSTNEDVIVKKNAAYRFSQQSMGSVKFDFSIETDCED